MKNKRLAILFVVVTLGGSPQVWQQLSNLVAAVQHKAQIAFLSMVLSPRTGSDEAQATSLVQSERLASCEGSPFNQAQVDFKTRTDSASHKVRTQQRDAARAEVPETVALKETARVGEGESLPRLHNPEHMAQNFLTMHAVTAVPPEIAMNQSNVVEVVVLPQIYSVAPAFVESTNLLKLKKTLDENKLMRLKTRYLINRPALPLPPSKAEAVGGERAG
ncbi:MAG: hypothetical protein QOH63_3573 [Acidobacteriota bacterium]|jgi:hypothetical protein|nr:hypothetical protein [Acidobacteriota bacterium]